MEVIGGSWGRVACITAVAVTTAAAAPAWAQRRCPGVGRAQQLTIDEIRDPAIPVVDRWQVLWRDVPLSDAQLAMLAGNDSLIELTREEMKSRGTWVYIGLLTAAAGTALSCAGWMLFGRNGDLPQALTVGMGLGGLAVGAGGVLLVTQSIQTPLEPHLAPTPRHRLTRAQARQLVAALNKQIYAEACAADPAAGARPAGSLDGPSAPEPAANPDTEPGSSEECRPATAPAAGPASSEKCQRATAPAAGPASSEKCQRAAAPATAPASSRKRQHVAVPAADAASSEKCQRAAAPTTAPHASKEVHHGEHLSLRDR